MPATTMLSVTPTTVALLTRKARYPSATVAVAAMSAMRGVVRRETSGKSSAPMIIATR